VEGANGGLLALRTAVVARCEESRYKSFDDAEKEAILAAIARDPEAYPRDRIAAIRALHDLGFVHEPDDSDDIYPPDADELSRRRSRR
jgi:hypothetical protein